MYQTSRQAWRQRIRTVIFGADTPAGKAFDVALLLAIATSVAVVMLESVAELGERYRFLLRGAEWVFTVAFTMEYVLRLVSVDRPARYARSFFGLVDLLSIIPTYLSLLLSGAQSLLVIRVLRLLRVFRVLKLGHFLYEAEQLSAALRASLRKITVFLGAVFTVVLIVGSLMYLIEGGDGGFTNIPRSVYWAIVTMTTVGYGDIAPQTAAGQLLASALMILGYGVIAVPTGLVSAELVQQGRNGRAATRACPGCGENGHDDDARHCKYCGTPL